MKADVEFGRRLRAIRRKIQPPMSQREFGKIIGVHYSAVSQYENAGRAIWDERKLNIAKRLKAAKLIRKLSDLLGGVDAKKRKAKV